MTQEYHRVINSYDDIEAQIAKNMRIKQLTERLLNLYEIRKMIFPQRQLLQNNLISSQIQNSSSQTYIKESYIQLSRDFNSSTLDTPKELKLDLKKIIFQSNDQSSSSLIARVRKQIEQKKRLRNLSSCNDLLGNNPQELKSQLKNQKNQNKQPINLSNNAIHLRRNFYKTRSFTSSTSCQTLNQVKEQRQESNEQKTSKTLTKKPRKYSIRQDCQTIDSPLKPTETSRISKDHETISVKDLFKKFNNNIAYAIEERNESQIKTRRIIKRSTHISNKIQNI